MTTPSNLYAEKIYSEQPTILWALDDEADYITLITETERDLSLWNVTPGTATTSASSMGQPFPTSKLSEINTTVGASTSQTLVCISPNLENLSNLNQEFNNLSIGCYIYSGTSLLESVSIGYEYINEYTSQTIQELQTYNINSYQRWSFVSGSFNFPDQNTQFRVVIKFNINNTTGSTITPDFFVNGVTAGLWSEEFNATSLGATSIAFPATVTPLATSCVSIDPYGLGGKVGYYFVKDNALLAKNSSVPMVYGSNAVTKLFPNTDNKPSLIVPGYGFLNKIGQYKDYTVEFWLRVNSDTNIAKKIFGPVASDDGLYVESGFLTLLIGNKFMSYFIGEWFRPMLIHVRVIRDNASVLVNGEEVINLPIETSNLVLPEETTIIDGDVYNQDWIGFYSYEDVSPVEIDCVAIYSYSVAATVAKRRWVYGQGVVSPEDINSAYGGSQASIDYTFADYTANYTYPDFADWQQGNIDNLVTTSFSLETPEYSLPQIFVSDKTLQELYDDNQDIQTSGDKFLTFRPNAGWNTKNCYLNFPRLSILNSQVKAIYGVFSSDDLLSEEILFKIYNATNFNSFVVKKNIDEIVYSLNIAGTETVLYTTGIIVSDEKYAAGIQIDTLINVFGGNVASFFGNQNSLQMYIGGDETSSYQFTGKIYSIGICTKYNANEIINNFESNGTAIVDSYLATGSEESANANELLAHTSSYTLLPTIAYNTYYLDIGVSGFWEDYLPLSYFGQFVTNDIGNTYYDLDFLQLNLQNPAPTKLKEYETTSSWTYDELLETYAHPTQRTYYQLDNSLITNWNDYQDMEEKSIKFYQYDTDGAVIKSYITFQYLKDGSNISQDYFTTIEPAKESGIIDVNDYPNWKTTKFEFVDNTLIYPNTKVDFNKISLVTRLEFSSRGIITKPIKLKKLEISSQSLNDNSFNPIGTKFGVNMFPFTRAGLYFDYKAKNPYSIYKGSTPYLYLSKNSGIELRGSFDQGISRGLAIPINISKAVEYNISAMQLWIRYNQEKFEATPVQVFEIEYEEDSIQFYLIATNEAGTRAKMFAKSKKTNTEIKDITYYINGYYVQYPVLTVREWAVIGIKFAENISFESFLGEIYITGSVLLNNIAFYQANNLQEVQSTILRPWTDILSTGNWDDWYNPPSINNTWKQLLVVATSDLYGVDPTVIYETYIGTNKIILDDNEGMIIDAEKLKVYSDAGWTIRLGTPV